MATKTRLLRRKPKNNRSGVVGVSETYNFSGNKVLECFSVNYKKDGKQAIKKFYFSKFGNRDKAFREAVKFRKSYEKMVDEGKVI